MTASTVAPANNTVKVIVITDSSQVPTKPIDGKPTLVYWDICGLAQKIRLSLVLAGVDFCDVRIDAGTPDSDDFKSNWFDAKQRVGETVPFPNLPYFLDEEVALSQSDAILRHVARKYGLSAPPEKQYVSDMVMDQLSDLDNAIARLAYPKGLDALKTWVQQDLPKSVPYFELLLGTNQYLTGEVPSVADAKLYELLRRVKIIECESGICSKDEEDNKVAGSAKLGAFLNAMESEPRLKSYMESGEYLPRPLSNPQAKFK